jgi:hypothetical protein
MKLTPDQIQAIQQWAAAGDTLNDIQRKLKAELNVNCTYMDLRLSLIDLGIKLQDKPKEAPTPVTAVTPVTAAPAAAADSPFFAEDAEVAAELPPAGSGKVTVTLDELTLPGTIASGKATFSDGKTLSWYVDQMGRLGMKAPEPGYQPPEADVPEFQTQLDRVLMQAGF